MKIKEWLGQGPFTLSLSSGFFGFYSHLGFARALYEEGFTPSAFRGASAGALIGSALASGHTPQEMAEIVLPLRRKDFWDPKLGFGLLRGERLDSLLQSIVKSDFTHLEKPLQVSAFDLKKFRTVGLAEGCVIKAVRASCALPGLFQPVSVRDSLFLDGGIRDPLGIHGFDPHHRILIHDISENAMFGLKPKSSHLKNMKMIRLDQIPTSGPGKMDRGRAILEISYQKTKALLQ